MKRLVSFLFLVVVLIGSSILTVAQNPTFRAQNTTSTASPVDFVNDTFTDTDTTVLSSHTGEVGATWTQHSSYATATIVIFTNRAYKDTNSGTGMYYASGTAANVNYTVEGSETDVASTARSSAICGWVNTASNSMIGIRRQNSTTVEFFKIINGTFTSLQTTAVTYTQDLVRTYKLVRSGNDVTAYLDGTPLSSAVTISDTEVSGVGRVGIRMTGAWPGTGNSDYPINYIKAYQ